MHPLLTSSASAERKNKVGTGGGMLGRQGREDFLGLLFQGAEGVRVFEESKLSNTKVSTNVQSGGFQGSTKN